MFLEELVNINETQHEKTCMTNTVSQDQELNIIFHEHLLLHAAMELNLDGEHREPV